MKFTIQVNITHEESQGDLIVRGEALVSVHLPDRPDCRFRCAAQDTLRARDRLRGRPVAELENQAAVQLTREALAAIRNGVSS